MVTNIPRPYRRALFDTLRSQLLDRGLDLRVLYTSDPAKHVRRGATPAGIYDPSTEAYVRGVALRLGYERIITIPTGLRHALKQRRPACVVSGGFGPSALRSALWCRRANVPHVLWSGAWPGGEREIDRLESTTRRWQVRHCDSFVTYGTAAAEYLETLGAGPDRVFCAWNTVDLEGIAAAAAAAAARRSELTAKYRLAPRNLLFVGSLVERKGLRELISAALSAEQPATGWALHLVGGGPLREELESEVRAAGKEAQFRFHGLRPETDVAELLGVADGFLLPTKQEAWGLVINEAMACGVPVVTSPYAGAARDLIQDGITGYIVEPADKPALAALISRLAAGDPACRRAGQAGAVAVREKASLEKTAGRFVAAVLCAIEGRPDEPR